MKKTFEITITKMIEINVPDEFLTEEAITEFCDYMFHVESSDDMMKYAAIAVAQYDDHFIEGIGQAGSKYNSNAIVVYEILSEDVEAE